MVPVTPTSLPSSASAGPSGSPPPGPPSRPPLLAAKLREPATHPTWRERERLSERLDVALLDATRLTVLSAPAGYGKSVAILGWLESRRLPRAWLSLDPGDNDPARLVRYLVAALDAVRPGIGGATLALLGTGTTVSAELVVATLLDEIASSDAGFVLVLDDLHALSSPAATRIVRLLVADAPPFMRVVALTRTDPDLPLGGLRATGRLLEIRADDLRFTPDEAGDYLARAAAIDLEPADLARLVERTEGWPAGLQLASLLLRGRPDPGRAIEAFHGSHRYVLDYLADEVVDGLDPALRAFLVRTSIVDRFDRGLAEVLAGGAAAALLDRAEERNLFVVPLDDERRWFRYHQLFADYLRTLVPADEAAALHLAAAGYLEAHGLRRDAVEHALASGDASAAVGFVRDEARSAFDAGELPTLLRWLDRLPRAAALADRDLAGLGAWSLFLTGDLPAARAWSAEALALQDPEHPDGRLLVAASIVAVLADAANETAEELALRALDLLGDDTFFRSQALLALGEVRLSEGRLGDAVETMREALDVGLRSRQPMAIFPIAYLLATAMSAIGRRAEAEALVRRLLADHSDARGRPLAIAGFARIALGALLYEANRLDEARREMERGFADAELLGFARFMLGQASAVLAVVRAATGSPDLAAKATKAGAQHARSLGMAPSVPQSAAIDAQMALARGDLAAAASWADAEVAALGAESPPLIPRIRFIRDTALARVLVALRRPDDALAVLAGMRSVAEPGSAVAFLVTTLVLEAAAHEQAGRRAEARRSLERAIDLAAPQGYVRRLVEDGRPVAALVQEARGRAPEFVDRVLDGLGLVAPSRPAAAADGTGSAGNASLVEPLTGREIDVLRLMAQGKSNAAIADDLVVSVATAKWHVSHVLAKLGATNRTDALVRAQRLGLV